MKRRLLLLASPFLLLFSGAHAQPAELTLQDSIALALKNNPGLKSSESTLAGSLEESKSAAGKLSPAFKVRGSYILRNQPDIFTIFQNAFAAGVPSQDVQISTGDQSVYNVTLSVEKPIFSENLHHKAAKAEVLSQEARFQAERDKRSLVYRVKSAFYEAFKDQLGTESLEKIAEAEKARLALVKELNVEGYVTREEVDETEANLADSELLLEQAESKATLAKSKLKRTLYDTSQDPLTLKATPRKLHMTASLDDIETAALRNREEVLMEPTRQKAALEDVRIARSDASPDVSLLGQYMFQSQTGITRPQAWIFGATLNWTPFDFDKTAAKVRSEQALLEKTEYRNEEENQKIAQEAEEAWYDVKGKEKAVDVKELEARNAIRRLQQSLTKYKVNMLKPADLLLAWSRTVKAYDSYVMTVNDLEIAVAHLEWATSTDPGNWVRPGEIFTPDLNALSQTVNEILRKPR